MHAIADTLLDRSLVLGYSRIGYALRRRDWSALPPDALVGRTVAVTGANAGLGLATAVGAARFGADVRLLCRNADRGETARREVQAAATHGRVTADVCDVSSLVSVRSTAQRLLQELPALHGLVHNAGVYPPSRTLSADGHEITYATHVLGPHLLTALLRPALAGDGDARVVFVTSGGMYSQPLTDDREFREGHYRGGVAYARTKRMQVVLAQQWADVLRPDGVTVMSMHPGWAATPGVTTSLPRFEKLLRPVLRTPEQGIDTVLWLLTAPEARDAPGALWHDRRVRPTDYLPRTRVDGVRARRLWDAVEEATGTPAPPA
ncbi:MAG: SDR family NAD(P)-dependent oxidoreductase [Jatrophihabitans sp.]|uniref:SDR family NAD(P)-dependent oxidoreductase n=1 Tax=Jatrophihabitans sp. TaxID=1932789 RepID=UPI003F7E0F66